MVLLNHGVQIAVCPHKKFGGQGALRLEFAYRYMRGGIAIQRDLLGGAPLLNGLPQEPLGRSNIAAFTQDKVNGLPLSVYTAIEVAPLSSALDLRLVEPPRTLYRPRVPLPVLGKLRNIVLHPAHEGGMRQVDAAFGPHRFQISVAQFLGEIPSDAQKKDLLINVTMVKQSCGSVPELRHGIGLSPHLSSCTRTPRHSRPLRSIAPQYGGPWAPARSIRSPRRRRAAERRQKPTALLLPCAARQR
jgi:hypothetical protein